MKIGIGCGALSMAELAAACGGVLCNVGAKKTDAPSFEYVCTDSREASAGALFIAMRGERADGHNYIGVALANGASCILCERIPEGLSAEYSYCAVVVEDSIRALGALASAYDKQFANKKVAITGSVGKTTTKEFVSAVLSEGFSVHKTEGNYNSTIGMPLSMLSETVNNDVSVLEMGMSNFGEIEYLSRTARPDIAIVTNIGSSHMEHLGSRDGICSAKMEIIKGLSEGGTLILNGDEPLLRAYPTPGITPIFVGIETECDYRAEKIHSFSYHTVFDIRHKDGVIRNVTIPAMGIHNVYAALFAFAVGVRLGMKTETILSGFDNYKPVGMRQNIYNIGGLTVIEDCYNASPESMRAALSVLRDLYRDRGIGRMTALLGDMYELGSNSERFHEEVGREFADKGGELLFTFGSDADGIANGAVFGGLQNDSIFRNNDIKNPSLSGEMLLRMLKAGDVLLVKASRGAAAERVLNYLKQNSDRLCRA